MAYTPASETTGSGNLPHLLATYYEKQAIPNLKANTPFPGMTKQRPLPMASGNQIQFFTYSLLPANVSQAGEGAVGSPITESSTTIKATIGQYADFINSSDLAMDVAIDNGGLLSNLSGELSYRLALTLNQLVQTTADTAVAVDSTVNIQLTNGSYLTAQNLRTARQQLAGINARPLYPDGCMGGIIHPYVVHDVLNDSSAGGLTDILKRSDSGAMKLVAPLADDAVLDFAGIKFKQTTTAPTSVISNNTYYNTYVFADDWGFSVWLGKNQDASDKNFKLKIQLAPEGGSVSDPAGVIGGWVAYNVKFTTTLRPASVMTLRRIQSQSSSS